MPIIGVEKINKFIGRSILALVSFLVFSTLFASFSSPAGAVAGINEQLNYQARLLTSTGATVPDGTYNLEFKIYQDGAGCEVSGTPPCGGTLKWTETRTGTDKVTVRNGYFSVALGSVTPFSTSVDWNQDTLWLSVNVGGTGTPTWDGEMTPFRRLAAVAYALNSKQLGGLDWTKFVQIAPSAVQTDSSILSTLFLNKTGASGNIVQLQKNGNNVLTVANGGATTITTTTNSSAGFSVLNSSGASAVNVDTTTSNLITNNSFETGTTGWAAHGATAISQSTVQEYDSNNSLRLITTAAANDGARFAYSLAASTQYSFSIFVRASGANFSTLQIGYSANGSTDTSCATAQDAVTTTWRRLTCTFTTGAVSGSPYVYIKQTDATVRTFYVDAAQLETAANPTLFRSGKLALNGSMIIGAGSDTAATSLNTLEINQAWGSDTGLVVRGSGENDLFSNLLNVVAYDSSQSFMTINEVTKSTNVNGGSSFFASPALRVLTTDAGASALDVGGAGGQTADIFRVLNSSSVRMFSVGATGAVVSQNTANSTTAFQILNASAVPLFVADTTNSRAYVGNPTADATGALLVLDTKNNAGDPTGVDGGMYYNSLLAKFRCFEDSLWKNCVGFDSEDNRKYPSFSNDFLSDGNSGALAFYPWQQSLILAATYTVSANSATAHPGVMRIASHATNANSGGQVLSDVSDAAGTNTMNLAGGEVFEAVIRLPTTTAVAAKIGYIDTVANGAVTDGAYIDINGTTVTGKTATGGVITTTTGSYTITANTWYRVKVVVGDPLSSGASFFVYTDGSDTPVTWSGGASTTAATVGTTTGNGFTAYKTTAGVANIFDIDYMAMWWPKGLAR